MAEGIVPLNDGPATGINPEPALEQDIVSNTSDDPLEREETIQHYDSDEERDQDGDDDEDNEDPYQELFMNAWRSAPPSSDEDDEAEDKINATLHPNAKPLSLMDDFDLWDYMDDSALKERLKDHPRLYEEITRKRKRLMLDEDAGDKANDDELCDVFNRAVKYIRTDPTDLTS